MMDDWSAYNAVLASYAVAGFIAWLFDEYTERARKRFERECGSYVLRAWRDRPL